MKLKLKLKCAAFAALLLIALTGCHNAQEPANPTMASTRTAPTLPAPPLAQMHGSDGPPEVRDAEQIEMAFNLASKDDKQGVFPKGVLLENVDIKENVATLNFSAEFNQVANMGETGESEVQKALIRIVAAHSGVEKMRVTVNRKPFDSQATDWNTPFSVRPSATGDANSAAANAKAGR